MTDQQLIGALKHLMGETGSLACLGCGHEHNCSIQGCNILREAVAAIQRQPRMRWIPVTERLPEEFISVVVSIPSEHSLPIVKEAYLANGCWVTKMAIFSSNDITHWMPLPEPPKGE